MNEWITARRGIGMPVLVMAAALLLAGCAQTLSAEVTRFNRVEPPLSGSFAVVPAQGQTGSLEFRNYADLLAARLNALGLTPAPSPATADYLAGMDYMQTAAREPQAGGPVNVGVGVGGGTGGSGVGLGLGFNLGGGKPDVLYIEKLTVTLTRRSDNQRVFEGYASTQDRRGDMQAVLPPLLQAVFRDFPGKNGETQTVKVDTGG